MNYGMKVNIRFSDGSLFKGKTTTLRNVTEVHYGYSTIASVDAVRVAFESDIHAIGCTYDIEDIAEFETELEQQKANHD